MSKPVRKPPSRLRINALLLAVSIVLSGCSDCTGCGSEIGREASKELTKSIDKTVAALPGIIEQIDKLIENNIGAIDETLAHQIQETNKLLKENIDGINAAIQDSIDNVDALLAARLDQIFKFAQGFLKQLDDIFAKRINQLTFSAQTLIQQLEVSGSELLESAGFQVVRTIREGNQVVAVVVGGVVETVIVGGAIAIILLVTVFGGIFFWRQRKKAASDDGRLATWQLGLGTGFFGIIVVIGALMIFIPSVRASVASGRVPLSRDTLCADAVPLGAIYAADHRGAAPGSLTPAQIQEGTKLLAALYQCLTEGSVADLRSKAREYSSAIERLIGADSRCRRHEECELAKGEHCQVSTGVCTARCAGPQHCAAGELCHSPDSIGVCGPPCSAANPCQAGLTCQAGECVLTDGGSGSPPPHFIPGGILDDIMVRPLAGCPGPMCPIRVCTVCGWTDGPDTTRVNPGFVHELPSVDPRVDAAKLRSMDRFFDPRVRAEALRAPQR